MRLLDQQLPSQYYHQPLTVSANNKHKIINYAMTFVMSKVFIIIYHIREAKTFKFQKFGIRGQNSKRCNAPTT